MTTTPFAAMSRTAALKVARSAVGGIIRRSATDYVFFSPYYPEKLNGPSTENQSDSYSKALGRRAREIASIALVQMGYSSRDAVESVDITSYTDQASGSAEILRVALQRLQAAADL